MHLLPVVVGQSSSSSIVGPTGTAPGVTFVEQAEPPVDDSTNTTTFGWPMGFAMLFLLGVVVVIVVRSRRGGRRHPGPEGGASAGGASAGEASRPEDSAGGT